MKQDELPLNAQSYAAIFECVERSDMSQKLPVLEFYYRQMQERVI